MNLIELKQNMLDTYDKGIISTLERPKKYMSKIYECIRHGQPCCSNEFNETNLTRNRKYAYKNFMTYFNCLKKGDEPAQHSQEYVHNKPGIEIAGSSIMDRSGNWTNLFCCLIR